MGLFEFPCERRIASVTLAFALGAFTIPAYLKTDGYEPTEEPHIENIDHNRYLNIGRENSYYSLSTADSTATYDIVFTVEEKAGDGTYKFEPYSNTVRFSSNSRCSGFRNYTSYILKNTAKEKPPEYKDYPGYY